MDVSSIIAIGTVIGAAVSAVLQYLNTGRYKAYIKDTLEPELHEVRTQRDDRKQIIIELEAEVDKLKDKYEHQARYVEKLEQLNLRIPQDAKLTELITTQNASVIKQLDNNHKEVITMLTRLDKDIAHDR